MKQKLIEHGVRTGTVLIILTAALTLIHLCYQEPSGESAAFITEPAVKHPEKTIPDKQTELQSLGLSPSAAVSWLAWIRFVIVYAVNLFFLYYAVQTLGIIRFIMYKQQNPSYTAKFIGDVSRLRHIKFLNEIPAVLISILKSFSFGLLRASAWLILFTPSYVVAYTFRTNFNTDSVFFMITLGCFTNGILIMYSEKFFHLLTTESRKGYVETALTNRLSRDFSVGSGKSLSWKKILSFRKDFGNHLLEPVYRNARFQYLSVFREQASFLISCMMIIEMALNIHGHLGYELLQRLLFREYITAGAMIFGIFIIVKCTELFTDYRMILETRRYTNP